MLAALGHKRSRFAFVHAARYDVRAGLALIDCYHCSRLNTNTGRLTAAMFEDIFRRAQTTITKS